MERILVFIFERPFLAFSFIIFGAMSPYIIAVICSALIKRIQGARRFEVEHISINEKWVKHNFEKAAHTLLLPTYQGDGRSIRTQKGRYRVDYMKDVNKTKERLEQCCCEEDMMKGEFIEYIHNSDMPARRENLMKMIIEHSKGVEERDRKNKSAFLNEVEAITPEQFFEIYMRHEGDCVGIYILYNASKRKPYVGQSKRVLFRINQHLTGKGNGDVYADYKYGDVFRIVMIKLSGSGYDDIDKLEKDTIEKLDAFRSGYNRTMGNGV